MSCMVKFPVERTGRNETKQVVCAALQKKLNPPDWPPPFEESGAAYIFDGPSG